MALWPASLPQNVEISGYKEQPGAVVIRTQMDAGPAKQRRRSTARAKPITIQLQLDATQRAAFIAFHENDIADGALSFTWVHPVTRAAATVRIVEGKYDLSALSGTRFLLSMTIEVLP